MATNWLTKLEVDVARLGKEKPAITTQRLVMGRFPTPHFDVVWGNPSRPTIDMLVSGDTMEILELRQEDDSYSQRPAELIKDMDKLLAIPDDEFLKYSASERSNLVARFSAVTYPVPGRQPSSPAKAEGPQIK